MRWSQQFIPTLREDPQEAEITSHRLMLRSGLIRRLGSGLYSFLPLGLRALHKVEQIVREEMDRAGALEVLMPALHPREIWDQTGRYDVLKDVMFSMNDRQNRTMVLGPTHEEIITGLVAKEIRSYRDLPRNFYQIQTKFRDEIRPRFGLMRAKEFIMKDAYSFDVDSEAADISYQAMYDAYERIFKRCGLATRIVEADTGAMGGSSSHEFMVLADSGEDGIVECSSCCYAANLERAESIQRETPTFDGADEPLDEVDTPRMKTVEEVASFFKAPPGRLVKTLIYMADEKPVAVLVPGDREVHEIKVARALGVASLALANDSVIESVTGAPTGFTGPVGISVPVWADEKLKDTRGMVTGANKKDTHFKNVAVDRDVEVHQFADLSFAREGDGCPRCDGTLQEKRGIEVGHVFKLGTKYTEALDALYLDENGNQVAPVMGSYGIGVTRTLQAVIEQSHDENGIIWPVSISPYQVEVIPLNVQHQESCKVADKLAGELQGKGIDVLVDDRDERPGVKFKDADLVGIPVRVAVGERSLADGMVELKARKDKEVQKVPVKSALEAVMEVLHDLRQQGSPDES